MDQMRNQRKFAAQIPGGTLFICDVVATCVRSTRGATQGISVKIHTEKAIALGVKSSNTIGNLKTVIQNKESINNQVDINNNKESESIHSAINNDAYPSSCSRARASG